MEYGIRKAVEVRSPLDRYEVVYRCGRTDHWRYHTTTITKFGARRYIKRTRAQSARRINNVIEIV